MNAAKPSDSRDWPEAWGSLLPLFQDWAVGAAMFGDLAALIARTLDNLEWKEVPWRIEKTSTDTVRGSRLCRNGPARAAQDHTLGPGALHGEACPVPGSRIK